MQMNRRTGSLVNRRITVLVVVLVVAVSLAMHGAFSQASPSSNRKAINLPDDNPKAPFSGAILSGNTLYVSGRIGIDSKTGNAPANLDEEIKLLLDQCEKHPRGSGLTSARCRLSTSPGALRAPSSKTTSGSDGGLDQQTAQLRN
jgi:hypothetical protein